uniref:Ribonuclease HII n=1 Tax=viral metagenome TaxID=1070528 RepID=A0A6C0LTS1_9ZZZZ
MNRDEELLTICNTFGSFGDNIVVGVDEAGRGCLAGPVVAGACFVPENEPIHPLIKDSKKMTEKQRMEAFEYLTLNSNIKCYASFIEPYEIDDINILKATMKAMGNVINESGANLALVDGDKTPKMFVDTSEIQTFIKGDSRMYSISCASVIAKVSRDLYMEELSKTYPEYGFENHMGYGTQAHMAAIEKNGPIPFVHRYSYAPIKKFTQ